MKYNIAIKASLLLPLLLLASCTKTPQEQIVGTWYNSVDGITMEFSKNGEAEMRGAGGSQPLKWSIQEEGKIILSNPANASESSEAPYKLIDEDTLELSFGSDGKKVLKRQNNSNDQKESTETIAGIYGGSNCVYQHMEFKKGGNLYITMGGIQIPASYVVDEDRVSVTVNGEGIVFVKRGNTLDGGIAGICKKQ